MALTIMLARSFALALLLAACAPRDAAPPPAATAAPAEPAAAATTAPPDTACSLLRRDLAQALQHDQRRVELDALARACDALDPTVQRCVSGDVMMWAHRVTRASVRSPECQSAMASADPVKLAALWDAVDACRSQQAQITSVHARSCCHEEPRVHWTGAACVALEVPPCYCGSCTGMDCGGLFGSMEACQARYQNCR